MLSKALDLYFEKFGENYPISVVDDRDEEEIIDDVRRCIESNTPAKQPEYEEGLIY